MASSSSRPKVNLRSTAVKRIMQEASELADPQGDDFVAGPLETDIFEWHCTMRGVPGSEYEGGLYHLRILLPPSYPMSAPDIILMTPNGRFELGKKICIDGLTSFHAGSWQPAWGVRTAITGLRSFWMQGGEALSAVGALDYSKEERRRLANLSRDWTCPTCQTRNSELLDAAMAASTSSDTNANQNPPTEDGSATKKMTVEIPKGQAETAPTPSAPDPPVVASNQEAHLVPDRPPDQTQIHRPIRPPGSPLLDPPMSRRPPLFIDAALFALVSLLVVLLARRLA